MDEANELLAALKPPAKEFDPAVFYQLGNAFQQQQRHTEALEQYKLVADASPEFGRNKEFRRTVKTSEKASGSSASILPRQSVFASRAVRWGAVAVLAIAAFVLGSIFVASSRTVHIVNGCDQDIVFQIDDGDSMTIPAFGERPLNLPEGSHEVTMTEPFAEPAKPFNISSSFFTRFFRSPAFILDPTETAAVVWERTTYAENPIDDYEYDIQFGELLTTYPHIDFQFKPFPDEIELDSRSSQVKRTRVSFQPLTAASFATGDLDIPPQRKLELLERRLTLNPKVEDEWSIYLEVANSNGKEEQARGFVSKFLDVEPLNVAIHRAYQDAMESAGNSEEVLQKYQKLFDENSHDPDYSYLLGRLQKSSSAAREYFEQTLKANDAHEYALYALGHIHLAAGDYNAASETLEKNWMLDSENEDYYRYYVSSLFGAKDYQKLQDVIATSPRGYDRFKYQANLLKLTGKDVLPLKKEFLRTRVGRENQLYTEFHVAYINQDLESFSDTLLGQGNELEQLVFRVQIAIEAHDLAASKAAFDELPDYLGNNLKPLLAVLQNRKGDQDEAGRTFDDYLATLDENGASEVADFCRKARSEEVSVAEFKELPLTIPQKRIIGLAIHEFSLNQTEEWKDHLKKINFSLSFPHYFIESLLE